ncbi:MAG TPA: type IV pilus biogenesis/stability protein PilW [Rhodanobacter sp.]|nr:type IV pilus biogenesis/stability protein PilW [Rhodanobacter sp.]
MLFKRALWFCLLLPLAGCVTTNTDSNSMGKPLPQASKATQAEDAARIHTELARHYVDLGDLQSALAKLNLALKFDPNYAPAHTLIAYVYEKINRPADAEINYRKAVELEPNKGAPNNNLGQFLCSVKKYAEGETYFRKAIKDPFYATPDLALTNAGLCQLLAGQTARAEIDFRDALAKNPNSAEALFQLANMLYKNKDAFRASAFLQRFDALGKSNAASLKLGYDIETSMGNREGAQNYRKRLLSQFPDSEQAHALDTVASP